MNDFIKDFFIFNLIGHGIFWDFIDFFGIFVPDFGIFQILGFSWLFLGFETKGTGFFLVINPSIIPRDTYEWFFRIITVVMWKSWRYQTPFCIIWFRKISLKRSNGLSPMGSNPTDLLWGGIWPPDVKRLEVKSWWRNLIWDLRAGWQKTRKFCLGELSFRDLMEPHTPFGVQESAGTKLSVFCQPD